MYVVDEDVVGGVEVVYGDVVIGGGGVVFVGVEGVYVWVVV